MNSAKLQSHMRRMSLEDLKKFLGPDIVESLLEWEIGTITKSKLSEMNYSIKGLSLFFNVEFRKKILYTLNEKEISEVLPHLRRLIKCNSKDPRVVFDLVSKKKWVQSDLSDYILSYFGCSSEDAFPQISQEDKFSSIINAHEKFYELLDYQYIIKQKAISKLTNENSLKRFLIHMPTGTGKTKTAMHIICHHINFHLKKKGLVLWIANTVELLNQAADTFSSVWRALGDGQINMYKLWGPESQSVDAGDLNGFMVCGIQKLISISKNDPAFFNSLIEKTRLIVFDEAHKAAAKESAKIINSLMIKKPGMENRSLMGLSATPGRTTSLSNDNATLVRQFGSDIIQIEPNLINQINMSEQDAINSSPENDIIRYFQERGVLSKIIKEELEYDQPLTKEEIKRIKVKATENGYDDFSSESLEIIGKKLNRNIRIVEKLKDLNARGIPTIVFACSVTHGKLLSSALTLANIPNALIIGEMDAAIRKDSIARFKNPDDPLKILINYEVLTTGFDATNIGCVFITRPTQSVVLYSQMLGRGLRGPQMGGGEVCLLIDVKDNLNQYNEHLAFSHFNNYWD